jgi:hypothetical protein
VERRLQAMAEYYVYVGCLLQPYIIEIKTYLRDRIFNRFLERSVELVSKFAPYISASKLSDGFHTPLSRR